MTTKFPTRQQKTVIPYSVLFMNDPTNKDSSNTRRCIIAHLQITTIIKYTMYLHNTICFQQNIQEEVWNIDKFLPNFGQVWQGSDNADVTRGWSQWIDHRRYYGILRGVNRFRKLTHVLLYGILWDSGGPPNPPMFHLALQFYSNVLTNNLNLTGPIW